MALRRLWRTSRRAVTAATLLGCGVFGATLAKTDDPSTAWTICTSVPLRLLRNTYTAALIAFDYEYSLWGVPERSVERETIMHEVHSRCAHRLQELCFKNGGIYIKLGQHLGQLEYLVPQEYVQIMRSSMLNRCPVSRYDQVCKVFMKELGRMPNEVFDKFDPVPFASASLAQVHAAVTHNGKQVAVKVQHTHMTDTAIVDTATVELIIYFLHWLFPSVDYRWLADEIRESLPKELDFVSEAKNSEKCLDNFRRFSPHLAYAVYAPEIHWDLTTPKLLTMELIEATEITDVKGIQRLGIRPNDVAKLVNQAFAEMMFKHGFVHCDPHGANLLVRPLPLCGRSISGLFAVCARKRKPQLILLDHGLYRNLDLSTRLSYAALWKAIIFADANGIKENSMKLGAGEDLYHLFAGVLTMRPWNKVIDHAVNHLALQGNEDCSELQMYASFYFPEISELLRRLPRVILLMLKTNDCLRAVSLSLLQQSSLESFLIIGKVSSEVVIESKMVQNRSILGKLALVLEEIMLKFRLFSMQVAIWLLQIREILHVQ